MDIQYIIGDATTPEGDGPKVIVHVCNDIGGWGRGFVMALSKKWKTPEQEYRQWHRRGDDPPFELGNVQFVEVETELWVANLIGQRDIKTKGGQPPVRYEAIRAGMQQVARFAQAHQATVHMPRIGCGLAGGQWEEIEPILKDELTSKGIATTVYDLAE